MTMTNEDLAATTLRALIDELRAERETAIEELHTCGYAKGTPGYRQAEGKVIWLNGKLDRLEREARS
ncbi:MAG: hypothetical protein V4529_17355 [Gemmatimonadota bacterium]